MKSGSCFPFSPARHRPPADLTLSDELYENWAHLNHAGAMIASARRAAAIVGLDPETLTSKGETQ